MIVHKKGITEKKDKKILVFSQHIAQSCQVGQQFKLSKMTRGSQPGEIVQIVQLGSHSFHLNDSAPVGAMVFQCRVQKVHLRLHPKNDKLKLKLLK